MHPSTYNTRNVRTTSASSTTALYLLLTFLANLLTLLSFTPQRLSLHDYVSIVITNTWIVNIVELCSLNTYKTYLIRNYNSHSHSMFYNKILLHCCGRSSQIDLQKLLYIILPSFWISSWQDPCILLETLTHGNNIKIMMK